MAVELASGYVNLSVRYASAMAQIAKDVAGIQEVAKVAGRNAGRNLSDGIDDGTKRAGHRAASNVEDGLDANTGKRIGARFGNAVASQFESIMQKAGDRSGKKFFETLQTSGSVGGSAKTLTTLAGAAGGAAVALGSLGPVTAAAVAGLAAVGGAAGGAAVAGLSALGVGVASVKVATKGLDETFKLAFDPEKIEEFNASMAKLGPQTQGMVRGVTGLTQAWKDSGAQLAVQEALFGGVGDRFKGLTQYVAPVRDAMVQFNTALNKSITGALDFVNSAQGVQLVGTWLRESTNIASNFASAIGNLVPGFAAVGTAATQVFAPLTSGIADAAKRFSDLLVEMQQTGELQATFERWIGAAAKLGDALKQVGGIIAAVFSAASAAGGGNAFGGITDRLRDLNTFLSEGQGRDALISFFKSSQAAIGALLPAVMELARVIGSTLAPIVSQIAQTIGPALVPAISAVGDGFKAAAPQFQFLAQAAAGFLQTITPIIPTLVQFAPTILVIVGAIKLYAAGLVLANAALIAVTIAQKAWMVATKAMAAAQWLLNAALTANPIGLIVAAVAALVAGIVLAYQNSDTFRGIVQAAWEGIKTAFSAAWAVIKPVLDGLGAAVMWLWNNVITPAFAGIKFAVELWWAYAQIVFAAVKIAVQSLGQVFSWLWQNAVVPAWQGIQSAISAAWSVIQPVWDAFKTGIELVGSAMSALWHNAVTPVWEGIKSAFGAAWDFIGGIFDKIKTGFGLVGDSIKTIASAIGDAVKGAFSGLADVIKAPLRALGGFLVNIPGSVAGVDIPGVETLHKWGGTLQGLAKGGPVNGPGGTDNVLAWLTAGEGVVTKNAMANGGATLVAALNAGWVPPVDMVRSMVGSIPGFAEGLNPGADFLRSQIMQMWPQITSIGGKRSEDGYGEHSSGNAIDVMIPGWDTPQGKALGDAVASFVRQNADALGLDGFIWRQTSYGYGGSFSTGKEMSDRGSPTQNHMDHLHLILGKGRGAGAPAVNVPTASLSLPSGGSVSPGSGSSGGGGGGGAATPKQLQAANDKITDLQNKLDNSETALKEAEANPKTKQSTLDTKRDAVEKNKRELAQAKTDLETLKSKTDTNGTGSKSNSDNPFSKIGEGIGQLADLAKGGIKESFLPPGFSDPEEWGITKAASGLLKFGSGLASSASAALLKADPNSELGKSLGTASALLGAGGDFAGGQTGTGISSLFNLIPPPKPNDPASQPIVGADSPHAGTGALPGPADAGNAMTPNPVPAGNGAGDTYIDNSVRVAENGAIGTDPVKVLEQTNRQQVAAQTPQLGTRRFI